VVSLDLSVTCCERASEWLKQAAAKDTQKGYEVAVICGDFFTHDFSQRGPSVKSVVGTSADNPKWHFKNQFDVVWDCTFLCALDPEVRVRWANRYAAIVAPDGEIWTLVFPIRDQAGDDLTRNPGSGPPYSLSFELVKSLLGKHGFKPFKIVKEGEGLPGHMSKRQSSPLSAKSMVVCWKRSN
jgi:hypothetical protein